MNLIISRLYNSEADFDSFFTSHAKSPHLHNNIKVDTLYRTVFFIPLLFFLKFVVFVIISIYEKTQAFAYDIEIIVFISFQFALKTIIFLSFKFLDVSLYYRWNIMSKTPVGLLYKCMSKYTTNWKQIWYIAK